MNRRERLERKLEKREEWAASRDAKANERSRAADEAVKHIPPGQPILVGHHSEKRHRRDLAKHDAAMTKMVEHTNMAEHHRQKADGLADQLAGSIFSDDEDAIERLEEKVTKLEARRTFIKTANKIVRMTPRNQPTPQKIAALCHDLKITEATARKLFEPDFCGRIGIPSYELQNLAGNIRRCRIRIAEITELNRRAQAAEEGGGVAISGEHDYITVTFAEKPDRSVLNELKANGFHWRKGSWHGRRDKLPQSVLDMKEDQS